MGEVTKPGYLFIYHNRDEWREEGVWAYIKENTAFKVRNDYYDTDAINVWYRKYEQKR